MVDDDDMEPADISLTPKQTAKVEKRKADKARENPSNTVPVACPDCECDYIIPLMKAFFTTSFAGNRMTIVWPERDGSDNTALVACPQCYVIYRVNVDGTFVKTGKKLKEK